MDDDDDIQVYKDDGNALLIAYIWDRPVYQPPSMNTPRPGADDHLNIKRRGV